MFSPLAGILIGRPTFINILNYFTLSKLVSLVEMKSVILKMKFCLFELLSYDENFSSYLIFDVADYHSKCPPTAVHEKWEQLTIMSSVPGGWIHATQCKAVAVSSACETTDLFFIIGQNVRYKYNTHKLIWVYCMIKYGCLEILILNIQTALLCFIPDAAIFICKSIILNHLSTDWKIAL